MEILPYELIVKLLIYLPQETLCALRLTSSYINSVAISVLYRSLAILKRYLGDLDSFYLIKFNDCILGAHLLHTTCTSSEQEI